MAAAEPAAQFEAAAVKVAAFLGEQVFDPMPADALARFGLAAFAAGWRKRLQFRNGQQFTIAVLLKRDFPFAPPRLAVLDGPALLSWPHLEGGGLLCVLPQEAVFDVDDPVGQVKGLVNEGIQLIERILSGQAEQDFRDEFVNYWKLSVEGDPTEFVSLLDPGRDHRQIFIWRGKQRYVVAETEDAIRTWLLRRYGQRKDRKPYTIGRALFLRAAGVPIPAQYPQTASDLRAMFHGDQRAVQLIAAQALGSEDREVIIGLNCPTGLALAPVTIAAAHQQPIPGRKVPDFMTKGFREGHVPPHIAALRAATPTSKVTRHDVERADHDWIHGRDHDARQATLKCKKVLVVGCGSLGSTVAELLAKGGVGHIGIIDGQTLDWPNISRHALGAAEIGLFKAESLAERLTKAFPHLSSIQALSGSLTPSSVEVLLGWDLVMGTTGIWQVDALINDRHQAGDFPIALYAWLEPHAAAAHAVTIPRGGACLRCNFSKTGKPDLCLSSWPHDGLLPVPACGGSFSPYGATELTFSHGLVAAEAIDALVSEVKTSREAIWVGNIARTIAEGGSVTAHWHDVMGDPLKGGFLAARTWGRAQNCTVCGKVAAVAA